jgi:hypothetical protein
MADKQKMLQEILKKLQEEEAEFVPADEPMNVPKELMDAAMEELPVEGMAPETELDVEGELVEPFIPAVEPKDTKDPEKAKMMREETMRDPKFIQMIEEQLKAWRKGRQ